MNRRVTALVVAAVVALLAALALFPARSHADVPAVASREALVFEPVRTAGPLASGQALIPAVRQVPTPSPSLPPVPRMAAVRSSGTPQRGQAVGSAASTTGTASTYGPGYDGYLALPIGPGHRVRICGAGGCVVAVSNDAGPSLAMQRLGRIVDLDVATFERVCGVPWTRGLCRVSVTVTP